MISLLGLEEGSGAGSIVGLLAWHKPPLILSDMIFYLRGFLNPERGKATPDFDIDFLHRR